MKTLRIATVTLGACTALAVGAVFTPSASAEEDWKINYSVKATTTVAKINQTSTTTGTAASSLTPSTGVLRSDVKLGDFRAPIKLLGIPVSTAVIRQEPLGPATGTLNGETKRINQTLKAHLRIVSISPLGGGHLNLVGDNCRTSTPATIKVNGTFKGIFDPVHLKGSYAIPPFSGCGLLTGAINQMVAGPGNSIALDLTPV